VSHFFLFIITIPLQPPTTFSTMGIRPAILENGAEFDSWSIDMESLLVIKGCADALEPAPADQDSATRTAQDRKAKAYLLSHVSSRFKKELSGLNAMDMWHRLDTTYRACLLARKIRLQGDLAAIQMLPKESVEGYFGRARGLINDLISCGESNSEEGDIARVLEGLSPAFSHMVDTIIFQVAADPGKWSWDRVVAFIIEGEARLARKSLSRHDEGGTALYTRGNRSGEGRGARGPRARHEAPRRDLPEARTCYFCGKVGHLKRDCRKYHRTADKQSGSVGAALVTCSNVKPAQKSEGPWWTLDSGCTDHMTGNKSVLTGYREVAKPWQITIADGSSRAVVGVGTAMLDTEAGFATLHDVLHVPGLNFNLASVLRMDQKGATVVMQHGRCQVRLHGRVVLQADLREGLYKIRTFSAFRLGALPPWPPNQQRGQLCGTNV
jgi:hypothetical protein